MKLLTDKDVLKQICSEVFEVLERHNICCAEKLLVLNTCIDYEKANNILSLVEGLTKRREHEESAGERN